MGGILGFFFETEENKTKDKAIAKPKLTKTEQKEVVTAKHSVGECETTGQTLWEIDAKETVNIEVPVENANKYNEQLVSKIASDISSKFTDKTPNYLNFFSSVQEMITNGGEIKSATSIAFGIFKNIGLSKESLLISANKYKDIIKGEINNFDKAFNEAYDIEVTKPLTQLQQNTNEIELLTKKINALNQENVTISAKVEQSKTQLSEQRLVYMFNIGIIEQATNQQIETITNLN